MAKPQQTRTGMMICGRTNSFLTRSGACVAKSRPNGGALGRHKNSATNGRSPFVHCVWVEISQTVGGTLSRQQPPTRQNTVEKMKPWVTEQPNHRKRAFPRQRGGTTTIFWSKHPKKKVRRARLFAHGRKRPQRCILVRVCWRVSPEGQQR
jgi:hypothetical protein